MCPNSVLLLLQSYCKEKKQKNNFSPFLGPKSYISFLIQEALKFKFKR